MRIIAGEARGRRLEAPAGLGTRPTSDRVRESLFNILGQRFDGGLVLDLYAGSGALGLEALSRGAERAILVDRDPAAAKVCEKNAVTLGFAARVEVVRAEVPEALRKLATRGLSFDLVFLDPPYAEGPGATLERLSSLGIVAKGGRVIAEHDRRSPPAEAYGSLRRTDLRTFGEPALSFFERLETEHP
ncbi:16S rRNA (guanine(966)-N(2))-methyltransferase RsmD [Vulgatibacter incomptus]|uniref:Ribosomal RNA small subunit methyltransferase D n=1 Tax=Vulgatibacter incomptus TaxID=1391653 RepID=A0A0K1PAF8_9BACT|nr:16S rRNA (guanine(966)-N(2))-methyltransferase RsmD [Vulgatibacter incomptus]AKU90487.1 Ribosomal RNA small subunit methyltransferase D [Vulgatibacter incomptus]